MSKHKDSSGKQKGVVEVTEKEFNNELFNLSSDKKEMIFSFGAILGISVFLFIFLFQTGIDYSPLATPTGNVVDQDTLDPGAVITDQKIEQRKKVDFIDDLDAEEEQDGASADETGESEQGVHDKTTPKGLKNFSLRPTCNRGFHVAEMKVEFDELPTRYFIEQRVQGDDFKTLKTHRSPDHRSFDYFYICDACPAGDDFRVDPDKVYEYRLKVERFDEVYHSEIIRLPTSADSYFRKKICGSKSELGCYDTEEEKNPYARGKITLGDREYVEFCINSNRTEEYWCEDNEVLYAEVPCSRRCWLGRCID